MYRHYLSTPQFGQAMQMLSKYLAVMRLVLVAHEKAVLAIAV